MKLFEVLVENELSIIAYKIEDIIGVLEKDYGCKLEDIRLIDKDIYELDINDINKYIERINEIEEMHYDIPNRIKVLKDRVKRCIIKD